MVASVCAAPGGEQELALGSVTAEVTAAQRGDAEGGSGRPMLRAAFRCSRSPPRVWSSPNGSRAPSRPPFCAWRGPVWYAHLQTVKTVWTLSLQDLCCSRIPPADPTDMSISSKVDLKRIFEHYLNALLEYFPSRLKPFCQLWLQVPIYVWHDYLLLHTLNGAQRAGPSDAELWADTV